MRVCESCQKESHRLFLRFETGFLCRDCYDPVPSRYDTRIRHSWSDGEGSIGVGHLEDIKHRKWNPSGEVTRDYGRKYFHG